MNKKIVFMFPGWDILANSGETEIFMRMQLACQHIDIQLVLADAYGNIYDVQAQEFTQKNIEDYDDILFVLYNHISNMHFVDSFAYMLLWNPPMITCYWQNTDAVGNYLSMNSYLTPSPEQNNYIDLITNQKNECLSFLPTISEENMLPPATSFKKFFYCGINWEKDTKGLQSRYSQVFTELSQLKLLAIYGPMHSWDGVEAYVKEIPFDGRSMLSEINKVGISLAFSGNDHIASNVVTNRFWESIAGGAIIIANQIKFIEDHFSDCVLFIDTSLDKESIMKALLKHYNWIQENPTIVKEMILKAQEKLKQFSLETQFTNLLEYHNEKLKLKSIPEAKSIDVLFIFNDDQEDELYSSLNVIKKQDYINMRIICVCEQKYQEVITKELQGYHLEFILQRNIQVHRTGYLIQKAREHFNSEYVAILTPFIYWNSNHLRILAQQLNETNHNIVIAPFVYKNTQNPKYGRHLHYFRINSNIKTLEEALSYKQCETHISQILIKTQFLTKTLTDVILANVHKFEEMYLLVVGLSENSIIFSNFNTFSFNILKRQYFEPNNIVLQRNLLFHFISYKYHLNDFNILYLTTVKENEKLNTPLKQKIESWLFTKIYIKLWRPFQLIIKYSYYLLTDFSKFKALCKQDILSKFKKNVT